MASRQEVMVELRAKVGQTLIDLAINAHANLVEATPVDTGWARANWIPGLGSPVVTVAGAPGKPDPSAAQAGLAAILAFKLEDGRIFVSNHVPYIARLDGGSSDQAPSGFVRRAIAAALLDGGTGRLVAAP